eukprot:762076-Hanusia_phi.AAC.1
MDSVGTALEEELRGIELFPCIDADRRAWYLQRHEEYLSSHREVRERLNDTLCHISKLCRAVARECDVDLEMDMYLQSLRDIFELASHEILTLHSMLQGEKRRTAILFDEYQKMLDKNSVSSAEIDRVHEFHRVQGIDRTHDFAECRRLNSIKVREEPVNPPETVNAAVTSHGLSSEPWYMNQRAREISESLRQLKDEVLQSVQTGRPIAVNACDLESDMVSSDVNEIRHELQGLQRACNHFSQMTWGPRKPAADHDIQSLKLGLHATSSELESCMSLLQGFTSAMVDFSRMSDQASQSIGALERTLSTTEESINQLVFAKTAVQANETIANLNDTRNHLLSADDLQAAEKESLCLNPLDITSATWSHEKHIVHQELKLLLDGISACHSNLICWRSDLVAQGDQSPSFVPSCSKERMEFAQSFDISNSHLLSERLSFDGHLDQGEERLVNLVPHSSHNSKGYISCIEAENIELKGLISSLVEVSESKIMSLKSILESITEEVMVTEDRFSNVMHFAMDSMRVGKEMLQEDEARRLLETSLQQDVQQILCFSDFNVDAIEATLDLLREMILKSSKNFQQATLKHCLSTWKSCLQHVRSQREKALYYRSAISNLKQLSRSFGMMKQYKATKAMISNRLKSWAHLKRKKTIKLVLETMADWHQNRKQNRFLMKRFRKNQTLNLLKLWEMTVQNEITANQRQHNQTERRYKRKTK